MLTLVEEDRYTYIVGASLNEKNLIRSTIRARPKGFQFMPSYRDGAWDGYISLLSTRKFPSGLLSRVIDALLAEGNEFEVQRNKNIPQPSGINVHGYELRDYQIEAVVAALTNVRGVLHMATNAGKTLVMASIIKATGNKAVVVVPTRALLLQTADSLEEMLDIEVGRFGANFKDYRDVTVVTMASLEKMIVANDLSNNVTVLIDESHHTRAKSIFDNAFDIPGPYRFGLSGTPLTYDVLSDMKLIGATGPVICEISNQDLIQEGWSVPPKIFLIEIDTPQLGDDIDYHTAYRECIVQNEARNNSIAWKCRDERTRGPTLILVNWIEHALLVSEYIAGAIEDVGVGIATGQLSPDEIVDKLQAMRDGKMEVLVATDIFGEGVDIPSIATLVLAGGGKSHIKLLQRVGRGLRTAENKSELHVYDFLDDTHTFMLDHSEARYKLYKAEGFDVELAKP